MTLGRSFFRAVFFLSTFLTAFSSLSWGACSGTSSNQTCTVSGLSITVPNNAHASTYPLSQTVGTPSMTGPVTHVDVTLTGVVSATDVNDPTGDDLAGAELLLVAPDGTQLVILAYPGDGFSLAPSTVQVIDSGADPCTGFPFTSPTQAKDCNTASPGHLLPGGNGGSPDGFSNVLSPGTSCTHLACVGATPPNPTMDGTFGAVANANGTWSLYVINNQGNVANFTFTGWSITVQTSGVAAAATTTTVSANPPSVTRTPPSASAPSTITATVVKTSDNSAANGGTVSFFDNGNPATCTGGNQTLVNGTATCSLTFTQEGVHPITAHYLGSAGNFAPSNSATPANVTVTVQTTFSNITSTTGTYCNAGTLLIPVAQDGNFAVAGPYPSQIFVGSNGTPNLPGVITGLTVDLKNIHHQDPNSPSLLLVSPNNTPYMLFADAYQSNGSQGPVNLTLADGHTQIPNSGGFTAGTFSPADYHSNASQDETAFPAPAPQSGFLFPTPLGSGQPAGPSTIGQAFNGGPASGTWQLYVLNDAGGNGAIDSGWCVNFTVDPNEHATTTSVVASPVSSYTSSPFTSKFPPVPANDFVTFTSTTTSDITVNTGTVTFSENGVNLTCSNGTTNPATVDGSGHAVCKTTFGTEGNHVVKGTFHAAATFGDSNSNALARVDSHSTRTLTGPVDYKYCNPSEIRLPAFGVAAGPGNPYPSNIFINDLPGTINKVRVGIPDLSFNNVTMQELTSLLVGPNQNISDSIDLFSHIGQLSGAPSPINITLDDAGANGHFNNSSNPTSGAWQPTSRTTPTFPALPTYAPLSPAGPYPPPVGTPQYASPSGSTTFAGVFGSGVNNTRLGQGTWSLYQNMPNLNSNPIFEGDNGANPGWCALFTVNPPLVTVTKSDQSLNFTQGQQGAQVYQITVHNSGPGPTGGTTTVTDVLPTGLTGAGTPGTGTGWSCTGTSTLTCTSNDSISQGSDYPVITLNVNVATNAASTGNHTVSNTASASGGGSIGSVNSNTTVTSVIQLPDLTISKIHVGSNFTQGQQGAQYTLSVSNVGFADTTGTTTVTDTLPTGLTFASGTGAGWSCSANGQLVTCTNPAIAVGATSNLTLNVNVASNAGTPLSNSATVACACSESNASNNASNTDMVTVTQLPDLTITKNHVGNNFSQGQQGAQYTLTVTNGGGAVTTGTVTVTDTLPNGLTFASGSGTGWSCSANGQLVTCTDAATPIAAAGNSVITLNVNVAANASTPLSNSASVACTCTESNTNNDTSTADLVNVTQLPDLTISKSHVGNSFTQGQQGAQYTLTVTNGGSAASTGTTTVTDTLPSGLTFASGSGTGWSCSANGQLVTCTDAATPIAGSGGTSVITLNVNVAANASTPLSNSASVACTCAESNTNNNTSNTDMVSVNTPVAADVTSQVTVTRGVPVFNRLTSVWSQNVSVKNNGPGALSNAAYVLDSLNAGWTVTNADGTTAATTPVGSPYRVLGPIAPNATVTITLQFTRVGTPALTYTVRVVDGTPR